MNRGAPGMLRSLLARVLPAGPVRDGLLGDLDELYGERLRAGRVSADLWYARQIASAFLLYAMARVRVRGTSGRRPGIVEELARDFGHTLRTLRREPGFAIVVVLTLALGMGATTAIFSIADALILRPLPVRDAERLALLAAEDSWFGTAWSNPIWESIRDRAELHDGAFAFRAVEFDLAEGGLVDPVEGLQASGRMFEVLGVGARVGRVFSAADDRPDGGANGPVAVLSHEFWQLRYGGVEDVVGRSIRLDGVPFTIVGVTPAGFFGPEVGRRFDVAVPLGTVAVLNGPQQLEARDAWWLRIMIRRPALLTIEQATAALRTVQPRIADETRPTGQRPDEAARHLERPFMLLAATAANSSPLRAAYRDPVFALLAIVGLTLLIACASIANVMLARSTSRRHELSVRAALGASGGRLSRQLMVESLLLSGAGAALGVAFAVWGARLVISQLSTPAERVYLAAGLDWRLLAFAGILAVGTAFLCGSAPELRAARAAPINAMRERSHGARAGDRGTMAGSLVVVQVALSLVLLIGAGLLVRSFASLAILDLGFDPGRALTVRLSSPSDLVDAAARGSVYERILAEVETLPNVERAGLSLIAPLDGSNTTRFLEFPDLPELPESERRVWLNVVSPGWFESLGMRLLAGRGFDGRDRIGAPRGVVVNETFVAKYFGGGNPIGRRIRQSPGPGSNPAPLEIIGVVADAAYRSVREPIPPTMYWALAQQQTAPATLSLVVRPVTGSPSAIARTVTDAIGEVSPDIRLSVVPLADRVDGLLTRERLLATLSGFFGGLALLLAGLGVYGVASHSVARRHTEIGIRMALGAPRRRVLSVVLAGVLRLAGTGAILGLLIAFSLAGLLEALLFDVRARDPITFALAPALLTLAALLACVLPARRAATTDPAETIRSS